MIIARIASIKAPSLSLLKNSFFILFLYSFFNILNFSDAMKHPL